MKCQQSLKFLEQIEAPEERDSMCVSFAALQARAGDIKGALATAEKITQPTYKLYPLAEIA